MARASGGLGGCGGRLKDRAGKARAEGLAGRLSYAVAAGGCGGRKDRMGKARAEGLAGRLFRAVVRADGRAGMPCGGGGFAGRLSRAVVAGGCAGRRMGGDVLWRLRFCRAAVSGGRGWTVVAGGRAVAGGGRTGRGRPGWWFRRMPFVACVPLGRARARVRVRVRARVRIRPRPRACPCPRPRLPAIRMSAAEKRRRNLSLPARKRIFEGH